MNISLTPELEKYVRDKVATGLYNNASEVIREALRGSSRVGRGFGEDAPQKRAHDCSPRDVRFPFLERHEYHDTYPTVLWDACKKDLTPLKEAVLRMAAGIDSR
jgi:hypothetical protein